MLDEGRVLFRVQNNWTDIIGADATLLRVLDYECQYPTEWAVPNGPGNYRPLLEINGWDGWVRLMRKPRDAYPQLPTGLLPRMKRLARKFRYYPEVEDLRQPPEEQLPEYPAIPLRDYQEAAVASALHWGRGVLDLPPRAGKTRMAAEIQRRLNLPCIWIAPTERIVAQTVAVLEGFFGRHYAAKVTRAAVAHELQGVKVAVCTAAMAGRLPAEWYASREMIMVDEFHHAAAKTYRKDIWPKLEHIYYRFGLTGTHFRSGDDAMAMHAVLSQVVYKVTPEELLRRGYLVPTHAVFLPVNAPRLRGVGRTFHGGFGDAGIHSHEIRSRMAVDAALALHRLGRRVMVLVGTKSQGRGLCEALLRALPAPPPGARFQSAEFLSTDTPRQIQQPVIDSFLEGAEVKVLLGTSLLGEGVDLPSADALIYARGEKAEVTLTQNIYRVGTAQPNKRAAIVVDFADRHNRYLMAHSVERLRLYYREPTFSVTILDHESQLEPWAAQV